MTEPVPVVYLDDPDAFADFTVTDKLGQNLDWADPQVGIDAAAYQAATWQGTPGPVRDIRLAMPNGLGLTPGDHTVRLKVPNGVDIILGAVYITNRA